MVSESRTPENYVIEKFRPVLCKMCDICEEAGLKLDELELLSQSFKDVIQYQIYLNEMGIPYKRIKITSL